MIQRPLVTQRIAASVLCVLLLAGCGPGRDFPFERLITSDDLPPGWYDDGGEIADEPGAVGRSRVFAFDPERIWLTVKQILTIYETEDDARAAYYADWQQQRFPTADWVAPTEATFLPSDANDQYRLGCLSVLIDGEAVQSCRVLQQHGRYISLLTGNIYQPALTLEQFEAAIAAADTRMSATDAQLTTPSP